MSNIHNYAQPTNFICGSAALDLLNIYCTSVSIPGWSLNHAFLTNGAGSPLNLTGDNIMFGSASMSVLIDEKFEVYFELIEKLFKNISPTSGSFSDQSFDFFIDITDSKGDRLFKVTLINAKLQALSDVILDSNSSETEITLNLEVIFDHIEFEKSNGTSLTIAN